MLCEDLLSSNPNLYMSLKIDSVSLPLNRPVDAEGVAKPGWLALVSRFADRFLIVSDNFYDALGVSLRDLPRAVDVLNFVPNYRPAPRRRLRPKIPAVFIPLSRADTPQVLGGFTKGASLDGWETLATLAAFWRVSKEVSPGHDEMTRLCESLLRRTSISLKVYVAEKGPCDRQA